MDYSPPGSSVHGVFQARILEWVAISFCTGSSWPRDWTQVSCVFCLAGRFFITEPLKQKDINNVTLKFFHINIQWFQVPLAQYVLFGKTFPFDNKSLSRVPKHMDHFPFFPFRCLYKSRSCLWVDQRASTLSGCSRRWVTPKPVWSSWTNSRFWNCSV